jgi:hypothetical protein
VATLLDDVIGIKRESVYNTPVTVDRFYPFVDGTGSDWDPRPRQSMGQQGGSGRRAVLGSRRYLPTGQGKVTVKVELESKAGGVLLDIAVGVSTVTAITGGSQMLFHPGIAGTVLPSATIQILKIQNTGSTTGSVETYSGCTASKVTIEQPEDDIATIEVEFDARSVTTATAAASQTYATAPTIFDHYQGAVGFGGTLTPPSTTVLATGLTAFADFREWKLELDQAIDDGRWIVGGRNQPTVGIPKIAFTAKVEFNATTITAGLIAGTKFAFYQTWTTPEVLGAGFAQLQVVIPQMGLKDNLPKVKPGETRLIDLKADVTNDGTNRDFWVVYRTSDTTL